MGRVPDIADLTWQAQGTFLKWKDGIAVKAIMMPKQRRSFFRHKAEILEVLGVNISKTVREEMGALENIKYHGEYLVRRDVSVAQGFLPGVLRPV